MSVVKFVIDILITLVVTALVLAGIFYICTCVGIIEVTTYRCMGNILYDPYTTISLMGTEIFRF